MLKRAKEGGYISGFKLSGKGGKVFIYLFIRIKYKFLLVSKGGKVKEVSHPLFAYDTLIFYKVNQDQVVYPSWIFMWLEVIMVKD